MQTNPMISNIQDDLKLSVILNTKTTVNQNSDFTKYLNAAANKSTVKYSVKKDNNVVQSDSTISSRSSEKTDSSKKPEYVIKKSPGDVENDAKWSSESVQDDKDDNVSISIDELAFNMNLLNQLNNNKISISENGLNGNFSNFESSVSSLSAASAEDSLNIEELLSKLSNKSNGSDLNLKELMAEISDSISNEKSLNLNDLNNGGISISDLAEKVLKALEQNNNQKAINLDTEDLKNILLSLTNESGTNSISADANIEKVASFIEKNINSLKTELAKLGINLEDSAVKDIKTSASEVNLSSENILDTEAKSTRSIKDQKGLNLSNEFNNFSKDDFLNGETTEMAKSDFQSRFESFMNTKIAESVENTAKTDQSVDQTKIIDKIVNDVTQTLHAGKTELEVKLSPESLGKLTIKVTMEEGKLSANIEVKNPEVKHIIETSIVKMREDLSQNGVNLEKVNIFLSDQDNFNSHQGKYFREDQAQQQSFTAVDNIPETEEPEYVRHLGYNTIEYTA
jgi:flagellar hook-length control protein FliK